MIIDQLGNSAFYNGLGPAFQRAFKYLKNTDLRSLPTGHVDIDGNALFAIVVDEPLRLRADAQYETHQRYYDIQVIVDGEELMGYAPISDLELVDPFKDGGDYAFYEGNGQFIHVRQGQFVIFAPQDGHMPSIAINDQPTQVRKVVLKVEV